jgi:hypothetical protein
MFCMCKLVILFSVHGLHSVERRRDTIWCGQNNGEEGDLRKGQMMNESMRRPFWELICGQTDIKRKL